MADVPSWDSTTPVDSPVPQAPQAPASAPMTPQSPAPTWDNTYDPEERYGTTGQQAITALEGFGQGLVGPLAPMAEKALGVNPQDIAGRAEVNPYIKGTAEFGGLLAPLLLTGGASAGARAALASGEVAHEAGLLGTLAEHATLTGAMTDVGKLATSMMGLGELGKDASYGAKVGSSLVRLAAESAVMTGSDDAAKFVYGDKDAPGSVEAAIADIGLSAVFGGVAGAAWTGVVSPLWHATIGNKVESFLKGAKYLLDDEGTVKIKDSSGVSPSLAQEIPGAAGSAQKDIPSAEIRNVADDYAKSKGIELNHNLPILSPDPERAAAIAKAYDEMQHAPNDPEVRKAYNALIKETMEQYQVIKKTGLKIEPIAEGSANPYKNSQDMINDVRKNNHMWYYPTSSGFGSNDKLPKAFSIISAQKGPEFNQAAHAALQSDLMANKAFKISPSTGIYKGGATEPGFMVEHDGSQEAKDALKALGQKYGQESVLHSEAGKGGRFNQLDFSDNRPAVQGFGLEMNPKSGDFTEHPDYGKFNLKFGSPPDNPDHPLLAWTPELINGKPTQANDIFRIVHDYFGHAKEGFGFGPKGEENAWHHHMQMFSPQAQRALTSETRGQNSWVNFGPHGAANRANPGATQYAEQKAGLLPAWVASTSVKPVTTVAKLGLSKKSIEELAKTGTDTASYSATQSAYEQATDEDSAVNRAAAALGIKVDPVMQAAMNGDPKAVQLLNELRESQHPEVLAAFQSLPNKVHDSIQSSLGVSLDDAAHYSERDAGDEIHDAFMKEYNTHYDPIAQEQAAKELKSAPLHVPDEARRDAMGAIIEKGMNEVGTDSPYYKTYENYAQRLLAKDTIGQMDQLKTEIFNKAKSLGTDINEKNALNNIRNMITEFQDKQIAERGLLKGNESAEQAQALIAQRMAANKSYRAFADMSNTLTDHLGVKDFKGAGTLKKTLSAISGEDLVKKFSPKGNADFIPFLQQYFPETMNKVKEIETKKFISPAIKTEQGVPRLNIPQLSKSLERLNKGAPEYANFVMPQGIQEKLQAAQTILDGIPGIKSSGTAGWISKLTSHLPASAAAAVGLLTGHNPIASYLIGEMAQRLGRDVPNEIKLSYLKWLGSGKPVNAEGFKTMVDYLHSAYQGETAMSRAAKNIFKRGAQVVSASAIPSIQSRSRLEKSINKVEQNPELVNQMGASLGHYMPAHQQALAESSTRAVQYLQNLKPRTQPQGPLDKKLPVSSAQEARYNRALDIAQNPAIIAQRIKDGTLQTSDIQDLQGMYPSYYSRFAQKLSDELTNATERGDAIPYKVRMSASLFLGQPLDTTMLPASIQATQMALQPQMPPPAPQGKPKKPSDKAGTMLQKGAKSYQTPNQAAESDRTQGRTD